MKTLEMTYKEERIIFGSYFWRFQARTNWLHCFGPVAAQIIMVGTHGKESLFTSWLPRSKDSEGKGWVPTIPFKGMPPMTRNPPTRPHLLKFPLPPKLRLGL
jgi:hypothetical protein